MACSARSTPIAARITPVAGGPVDKKTLTQVGRALKQLGIRHIPSYTPEGRGRMERVFRTWQQRLAPILRRAGLLTTRTPICATPMFRSTTSSSARTRRNRAARSGRAPASRLTKCQAFKRTVRSGGTIACPGSAGICKYRSGETAVITSGRWCACASILMEGWRYSTVRAVLFATWQGGRPPPRTLRAAFCGGLAKRRGHP
jgi:hypothetical protein